MEEAQAGDPACPRSAPGRGACREAGARSARRWRGQVTTTSLEHEVTRRKYQRQKRARATFGEDIDQALEKQLERTLHVQFPSPKYARNPSAFFREILGVEPWSRQVDILEAIRDHDRVAVCSGHKVSKSHSAAGIALWFYCSFKDARVVLTSTTARQVDQILWRELRMLRAR